MTAMIADGSDHSRQTGGVSIADRLADADLLWREGHREGALLSVLVAVSATARRTFPDVAGDRDAFVKFMKTTHGWTMSVEHRGEQVDMDLLFYKWLRCELVHVGELPTDIRIDDAFSDPTACSVRAGGAPGYAVLLSPGWYQFLVDGVVGAPANSDLRLTARRGR
jgi:hypothetical protein